MAYTSSLTQFLTQASTPKSLSKLLNSIADACVEINQLVRQGALADVVQHALTFNVQGEVQQKLDWLANQIILETVERSKTVLALASEEMETLHPVANPSSDSEYLLVFDPLDGSSNIDISAPIGTIFSVLKKQNLNTTITEQDFLQAGKNQVAAGYVLYGAQTILVLSAGQGVHSFTLDTTKREWLLTQSHLQIAQDTQEYAINVSNTRHWYAPVQRYVAELNAGVTGPLQKNFNMRWIAAMVADVHRILMRGGIFMYPADTRNPNQAGKLRLLYEANPMSFLIEQAGGKSHDGQQRMLDIQPTQLHQRVAVFLGAANEVDRVLSYHI